MSFQVMGQGPRPALLLHCSLAHSGAWKGVAAHLGDLLTMRAADLPGHGRSADWDGKGDYTALATRGAAALMGAGPVDLVGHSFGGVVALRLALEQPRRVRSLVLIEPVLFRAAVADPSHDLMGRAFAPSLAAWRAGDAMESARAFHALWGDGVPWEGLTEAQRAGMAKRIATVWAADPFNTDPAGLVAPGRLESLALPVLLVEGERSPPVIHAINSELARRLPDAQRVMIGGAGHMVPITHAQPVADAIAVFLAR